MWSFLVVWCADGGDGVVPLAMPVVALDPVGLELPHLLVGDLDALLVRGLVEAGGDGQAALGGDRADRADDHGEAGQRPGPPVHRHYFFYALGDLGYQPSFPARASAY